MTMNRDELLARMAEHLFRKFEVRHATVAWNDAPQKWRDEWLEEAREIFAMVLPQRPEGAAVACEQDDPGDGTKFSDVRKRIADLITHAAYIVNYYDGADFDDLRNRVAACRATQGAHR